MSTGPDRLAYHRAWYAAHREAQHARSRAYYAAHKEERRAYDVAHREERRASTTRFKEAHREELCTKQRARYAARPPVVYAWFAPDGVADYVGRGTEERAKIHGRLNTRKPWWTPRHLLISMTCDSEWQAMELEGQWGARLQPRHNKEGYRHEHRT